MAAGILEPLVAFWKEWGILSVVLISFSLQVILLITAEFRRRKDSGVLKVVVWSAYLLADTTAIYALGHMSVTCTAWQEYQLTAFWAPFLLLHLGGQDHITAYSIEDNRLWLRHLQSFVVQVVAAAYVLYQSSIVARGTLLRPAAILMFVVGAVKYGERVCALMLACSGSNLSGKNYQAFKKVDKYGLRPRDDEDPKYYQTYKAHVLLDTPKNLLKGPLPYLPVYNDATNYYWEDLYPVAEIQLSLMHDVFYSKAELIHTWHGYCIRVFSLPATVAALLLFHRFSEKDGYRRADVAATYVLLAGAVVLEITSVLRAVFSSWTYRKLIDTEGRVARLALRFRSHAVAMYEMCRGRAGIRTSTRYWSGSMGQHNFIYMCSHCRDSRGSKIARRMGLEDWWNMLVYTSSVPVSPDISQLVEERAKCSAKKYVIDESPDHIHNSRGRAVLKERPGLHDELGRSVDTELDETILVWHIATHVYLSWYEANHASSSSDQEALQLQVTTKKLSNYMMFLLAARPHMLPDNASRKRYVELCYKVIHELNYSSEEDLLKLILDHGKEFNYATETGNVTFDKASKLGFQLISKERQGANILKLISQVWVELLCYAAYRCIPDSHAKQLSNGGEFTTVVAFMLEYMRNRLLLFRTEVQLQ